MNIVISGFASYYDLRTNKYTTAELYEFIEIISFKNELERRSYKTEE